MAVYKKVLLVIAILVFSTTLCVPIAFSDPAESGTGEAVTAATPDASPSCATLVASDADAYAAPDEEEYQSSVAKGKADEYQQGELSSSQGAGSGGTAQIFIFIFALVAVFAVVCIAMAIRLGKKTKVEKKPVKVSGAHSAGKIVSNSAKIRR